MSLKNYYKTLGVSSEADGDAIRVAYRALAKKYHPDAAPDNPYAAAHFAEISEAYEVLSNARKRTQYDEERWLRGLSDRSFSATSITPEWILAEAIRLRRHMASIDTYRMNHAALRDYVLQLLSPQHLSVLQDREDVRAQILEEVLNSTHSIHYRYAAELAQGMHRLAAQHATLEERVSTWEQSVRREAMWERYRPLIIILFGVLISLLIWWVK
jgi:curved DNA-binding protein CbpA